MANKPMGFLNIGSDDYELVDVTGRQNTANVAETVSELSASNIPYSSEQSTKDKIDAVANSIPTVPSNEMLYANMSTTNGSTYTIEVSGIPRTDRFEMLILQSHATTGYIATIGVMVDNYQSANRMMFSAQNVTYSNNTITLQGSANTWVPPMIIYPKGYITFQ